MHIPIYIHTGIRISEVTDIRISEVTDIIDVIPMMSYDLKNLNDSRKQQGHIDCDIDLSNKGNSQVQSNAIFSDTSEINGSTNDDNGGIATSSHDIDCHNKAIINHEMKNGIIKKEDDNNDNHKINNGYRNDNDVKSIYSLEVPLNDKVDEEISFVDLSGNMDIIPGCTDNMDIRISGCSDNMDIRLSLGLSRCSDNMDIIPGCSDKTDDDALDALVSISFPVTPTNTRQSIDDVNADSNDDIYTLPRTSVKEIFREGMSIRSSGYSENKQDNLSQKTLPYYSDSEESTGMGENEEAEEGGGLVEIVLTSQ
jgi:hypothetical protein